MVVRNGMVTNLLTWRGGFGGGGQGWHCGHQVCRSLLLLLWCIKSSSDPSFIFIRVSGEIGRSGRETGKGGPGGVAAVRLGRVVLPRVGPGPTQPPAAARSFSLMKAGRWWGEKS